MRQRGVRGRKSGSASITFGRRCRTRSTGVATSVRRSVARGPQGGPARAFRPCRVARRCGFGAAGCARHSRLGDALRSRGERGKCRGRAHRHRADQRRRRHSSGGAHVRGSFLRNAGSGIRRALSPDGGGHRPALQDERLALWCGRGMPGRSRRRLFHGRRCAGRVPRRFTAAGGKCSGNRQWSTTWG